MVLEQMPAMERSKALDNAETVLPTSNSSTALLENGVAEPAAPEANPSALVDLLGLLDGPPEPAAPQSGGLGDILGLGGPTPNLLDGLGGLDLNPVGQTPLPTANGGLDNLLNGLDTAAFVVPTQEVPSLVAYEKHGLKVVFTFPNGTQNSITLLAHNLTGSPIDQFVFQVFGFPNPTFLSPVSSTFKFDLLSGCCAEVDVTSAVPSLLPHHPPLGRCNPAARSHQHLSGGTQDEAQDLVCGCGDPHRGPGGRHKLPCVAGQLVTCSMSLLPLRIMWSLILVKCTDQEKGCSKEEKGNTN